ncbi:transposase, partial [Streptomyces aureus]
RRIGGVPGERIAGRPVIFVVHPAGRPMPHLHIEVLRRPLESTQYTSIKLTTRLMRAGVEASMGSVGDSYDNALAENLWMLIKTEGLRGRAFTTRAEANLALFDYIDGFYNSRRIQERLGFLSPIEFEEKYYADQATAEPTNLNTRQPALTS